MSIRLRLFLILALATGVVWLSAVVWIERSTRAEVERVLDARLEEAARMVSSLITDQRIEIADSSATAPFPMTQSGYSRELSCQVWSLEGRLVGQSEGAPDDQLTRAAEPGLSNSTVNGEPWRVFTVVNEDLGVRVMVGDSLAVRNGLIRDVVEGLLIPAAVILPILGALLWVSLRRGLSPLDRLARDLESRAPADLQPIPHGPTPREIRPVREALNRLFVRVERSRAAERDFTNFAAHELKTPLAGLRTQAQIARTTEDADVRGKALRNIETSVVRTNRMVRQLLELAAVEGEEVTRERVDLQSLVGEVLEELAPLAEARGIWLRTVGYTAPEEIETNAFLLSVSLRNLLDNAIGATPEGGDVDLTIEPDEAGLRIRVTDDGPGIPDGMRPQVTERFYRGSGVAPGGSGLGLSIVSVAMERLGGSLDLIRHQTRGEIAELRLPAA